MSRYFPTPTRAKPRINPLIKLFVWRCSNDGCKYVNDTLASERGYVRMISTGEELPEPMWYGEKCEMCRQKAGKECLLLQVKLLTPSQPVSEAKGNDKAVVDEDVENEG
ncbi:hypothetical protein GT037_001771 [Alternaria burnsii]|uniref:Uncharacterized protein n=1 Tax=Alternaria burnsii TaxID=1187904 RepID=A0A8H7BBM3_9PLEO|nr:uncharacterized protein GT037_001771 [Alternaria burnsii]KAF7680120.1 hypothetical protein GT037_001771 [Alternaria burnsii]